MYEPDELSESLMHFRLVYEGPLSSAAKKDGGKAKKERHAIRRVIHTQLKRMWASNSVLLNMQEPDSDGARSEFETLADKYRLCDRRFVPLVSEFKDLVCSIDILFLRRQEPGGVLRQRGDLDNRLSQLFDALAIPRDCDGVAPPLEGEDPFFCLLQDDSLVTGFTVTSDRLYAEARPRDKLPAYYGLLEPETDPASESDEELLRYHEENDVLLVMSVTVRGISVGFHNIDFTFQ